MNQAKNGAVPFSLPNMEWSHSILSRLSKDTVHVGIKKGEQIGGIANTPSLASRINELDILCLNTESHVNLGMICIMSLKIKEPSKLSICYLKPLAVRHPKELPSVSMLLGKQGGIKLHNYFIVPNFL
jgi:hypothetical protein